MASAAFVKTAKGLAAALVAVVATYVASPDVLNLVPTAYQGFVTLVAVPAIFYLDEKYLGYKAQKALKK